ncbi:hypothetical protein SASPL_118070 [Salvia splendens]|uniref:Uncharacterized protein n=1 Tax=Salvia splendens TaxID=180675 RepID=A0A8X8ZZJ3_SALSN|nr:hypothetical protein SASPL_118070 [Salvia splendens]
MRKISLPESDGDAGKRVYKTLSFSVGKTMANEGEGRVKKRWEIPSEIIVHSSVKKRWEIPSEIIVHSSVMGGGEGEGEGEKSPGCVVAPGL